MSVEAYSSVDMRPVPFYISKLCLYSSIRSA